ncbi:MAG TPA: hypothetical protein VK273_00405, partial [Gaiellaceae bacterium]|nr:hypothetical protein [Gaiellaceae bacterium]
RGLRPNTLSTYRMLVEKHLIPRVGSVPLQKLSASHLNAAYADMLASGRRNVKSGRTLAANRPLRALGHPQGAR